MPFSPTDLQCLLAWYNLGQGGTPYTETNCAKFTASGSSHLSLAAAATSGFLDSKSQVTIAVDVLVNSATVYDGWVTRWDTNQAQFILRSNSSGAIEFIVASGKTDGGSNYVHTATGVVTSGLPLRVVAVFDGTAGSTLRALIYVNGQLVTTTIVGTIPGSLTSGSTAPLRVGADFNASHFHDGLMSRACIWVDTALTADAVVADFNWWIGRDPPGCGEPFTPTHAWRLNDAANGTRADCIGSADLTDVHTNVNIEAHVTQVNDLSGNGFHATIRPINGPTVVSSGLNGNPTIKHVAAHGQFLLSGISLPGLKSKPYGWSLYAIAKCTSTSAPSGQYANGLVSTYAARGYDIDTWLVCVLGDTGGSGAPAGSVVMGCGDDTHYNHAYSPGSTYSANTWFHLTGIFLGGVTHVSTWFNGTAKTMAPMAGAQDCECFGAVHQAVIGAATAEGQGPSGFGVIDNDFFDGQWADIAICAADTSSQRTSEESWQVTYGAL